MKINQINDLLNNFFQENCDDEISLSNFDNDLRKKICNQRIENKFQICDQRLNGDNRRILNTVFII